MDLLGRLLQVVIFVFAVMLGIIPAMVAGVFAKALLGRIAFWPAFAAGMFVFLKEFEPLRFLHTEVVNSNDASEKTDC